MDSATLPLAEIAKEIARKKKFSTFFLFSCGVYCNRILSFHLASSILDVSSLMISEYVPLASG